VPRDGDRLRYERRSDLVSGALVVSHLAFVLLPLLVAAWVGPSAWLLLCWLWFGLVLHGITNLMHETSHFFVFRGRRANDWLGEWVLTALVLTDFAAYRRRHWDHHRFVGEEGDTKDAYLLDLRGWRMLGFLLRCLTLREAARKFSSIGGTAQPASSRWILRALLGQAVLMGGLFLVALAGQGGNLGRAIVAAGLAWGFVYLHGMATLSLFIASLRTLAEHGPSGDGAPAVGRAVLRNFECGPLGRLLMGCYGFAEHATHHREPAIPAYHLAAETRRRIEAGETELVARRGGYPGRLWDVVVG
jgi:fatty acid desaturase